MSTLPITFKNSHPSIDVGRIWLKKTTKEYEFYLASKTDWENVKSRFATPDTILNLGTIVEVLNASPSPIELGPNGMAIKDRIMVACKKHNDNLIQYLKYLIIPWIVCKIFGWTCLTTYELPSFTVNTPVSAPVQVAEKQEEAPSKINLTNKGLTTIPDWVLKRTDLKELILEGNHFSDLPEALEQLSQLEVLKLDHNPFAKIPDVIFKLKNLKHLSFHGTIDAEPNTTLDVDPTTQQKFTALSKLKQLELTSTGGAGETEGVKQIRKSAKKPAREDMLKKYLPTNCQLSLS